ncbi:MAG: hypothetical protein KJZ85_12035 [Rhodobacteraceae bacterium]|jgi:hypothetical protein|nr:hypothetical protein [Paracoccaceae bacterium]
MTAGTPEPKPGLVSGALVAAAGLVVAFLLLRFVPDLVRGYVVGALSGGFGAVAATRVWPGLPLARLPQWLGAIVAYGLAIAAAGAIG